MFVVLSFIFSRSLARSRRHFRVLNHFRLESDFFCRCSSIISWFFCWFSFSRFFAGSYCCLLALSSFTQMLPTAAAATLTTTQTPHTVRSVLSLHILLPFSFLFHSKFRACLPNHNSTTMFACPRTATKCEKTRKLKRKTKTVIYWKKPADFHRQSQRAGLRRVAACLWFDPFPKKMLQLSWTFAMTPSSVHVPRRNLMENYLNISVNFRKLPLLVASSHLCRGSRNQFISK